MRALNTQALGTGVGAGADAVMGVGAGAGVGMGTDVGGGVYRGSELLGIYVREGCIELVLDLIAWHGGGGGGGGGDGGGGGGSSSSAGGLGAGWDAQAQGQPEGQVAWAAVAGVVPPGTLPPGVGPQVVLQQLLLLQPANGDGAACAAGGRGQEPGCTGCGGRGRSVDDVAETVLWGHAAWGDR